MAGDWFHARGGKRTGPVSTDEMKALLARGDLMPQDLVWRDGMAQWTAASEVPELAGAVAPIAQPLAERAGPDPELAAVPARSRSIAELYSHRNRGRRNRMLFSVFGNAVVLNRALGEPPSIVDLPRKLNALDATKFHENKKIREATLKKTMQIAMALPDMKQRLEITAMLYPYYWVEQEATWLQRVFGAKTANRLLPAERRRLVPVLRQHVRTCQAGIQRPLAEIESAVRPVEEVMAREEVQQHWSSKTMRYLPVVAQGVIGAAFLFSGAGAPAGAGLLAGAAGQGFKMLAGAVAIQGLGGVLAHFEKDRIASSMLRRAGLKVFPWWQLFLNSLSVSLFETGAALDEESNRAMVRDRKLVDGLPAAERAAALKRLAATLADDVERESRLDGVEIVEGIGMRWRDVVGDMNVYMGDHLKKRVAVFTSGFEPSEARLGQGG
jgi:hypothetical protein